MGNVQDLLLSAKDEPDYDMHIRVIGNLNVVRNQTKEFVRTTVDDHGSDLRSV